MTSYHVEIIRDSHDAETRQARHDWAAITGVKHELKPSVVRDLQTGDIYAAISGAIGWPTAQDQGCMIIVGITTTPLIRVMEFREHRSVYALIEDVVMTRKAYRYGQFGGILPDWTADPERYQALVTETSVALEARLGQGQGLYIREPADWYDRHAFPLYMWHLRDALGRGQVSLDGHPDIVSRLQAIQPDIIDKAKIADYPAAGMLAGLVHTILTDRSWEQDIDHDKPILTEI